MTKDEWLAAYELMFGLKHMSSSELKEGEKEMLVGAALVFRKPRRHGVSNHIMWRRLGTAIRAYAGFSFETRVGMKMGGRDFPETGDD